MPNSRRGPKKFGTPPMDSVEVISGPRFTVTVAGNCNRMAPRGSGACGVTVDSGSCASGLVAAAMVGAGGRGVVWRPNMPPCQGGDRRFEGGCVGLAPGFRLVLRSG